MMTEIVESSLDCKRFCADFFVNMYRGIAQVKHVELSHNSDELLASWCNQPTKWLLNRYDEAQMSATIATCLEGVESCAVVFQVGPSFLSQYNTTTTEAGWLQLIHSSGGLVTMTESIEVELVYNDKRYDIISCHWSNIAPYRDNSRMTKPRFIVARISHREHGIASVAPSTKDMKDIVMNDLFLKPGFSLFYVVHFFQDLVFLRGLVDRVGHNNVYVIVNDGNLTFHHNIIVQKYLNNHVIEHSSLREFELGTMNAGDMLLTSTLGPLSPMHFSCTWLIIKARELKVVTITLQHGITLPDVFMTMTDYTLAWSELAAKKIITRSHNVIRSRVLLAGNIRPNYKSSPYFIADKFGPWVSRFERRVMIATNLHWMGAHGVSNGDVTAFIINMSMKYPETLFLIRPHPEDFTLRMTTELDNIILIDDVITGLLDVSIDQLLVNCDCVLSTYSTLLYDAARNKIPFAVFDYNESMGCDSNLYPELARLIKISNVVDMDLDVFIKDASVAINDIDYGLDEVSFLSMLPRCHSYPITEEQHSELNRIAKHYQTTAPDYGCNVYRKRLESAFMDGVSKS